MNIMRNNLIVFILAYLGSTTYSEPTSCEPVSKIPVQYHEGLIGELREFPWLGVIKVHLFEGKTYKIAATGAVMIKENHIVANADDIIKIPRHIFLENSKAMFILKDNEQTYYSLKDFITHPEYDYATLNTIALIELVIDENSNPGISICWPKFMYNTSNELYAVGFTDENKLLEKVIYKIQYLNVSVCDEFYQRSGLDDYKSAPTHYHCGFASNNKDNCQWENGMVLASNSTGTWMMIGFSIKGPGCAAPSRFIDMFNYFNWIDSMTELETNYEGYGYRKSARKKTLA